MSTRSGGCSRRSGGQAGHPQHAQECEIVEVFNATEDAGVNYSMSSNEVQNPVAGEIYQLDRVLDERIPKFVVSDPGILHPNHPMTTVLAKISPKPNMTPFTNGRNMLIVSDDKSA